MNILEASPTRTTLEELDHPQPPTPIQTDNSTVNNIMNKIKQKQSKVTDKRLYWLQASVEPGEFGVSWAPGKYNLTNYYTKYHSLATHRRQDPSTLS